MAILELDITDFEKDIRANYVQHCELRGGLPVYGLEHGLGPDSVQALKDALRLAVSSHGVERAFELFPLSVVACSSEVGYEYCGTGTDFWPMLEAVILSKLGEAGRQAHTEAFLFANKTLRLKSPPATAWSRNFRHIAWPVTNAIASREIHRPLAMSLRRTMTFAFSRASVEELVAKLAVEARGQQNTRLTEWLQHTDAASALIKRLLEIPTEEENISNVSLDRIVHDLEADPIARKLVAFVSEKRKSARTRRQSPKFRFHFTLDEHGNAKVTLRVPPLAEDTIELLENELAKSGGRVLLTEDGCEFGFAQLVRGSQIHVENENFPSLLMEENWLPDNVTISESLAGLLRELMPSPGDPLVFVEETVPGSFIEWSVERTIPKNRRILLATSRAIAEPEGLLQVADFGQLKLFEADLSSERGPTHLLTAGFTIDTGPDFEMIGGIQMAEGLLGPIYSRQMPVLLKRVECIDSPWDIRSDAAGEFKLAGTDVAVILDDTPAHQTINVRTRQSERTVAVEFVSRNGNTPPLSIQLEPSPPTVEDIQRGQLHIRIYSPLDISDAHVELHIMSKAGPIASFSGTVSKIPAFLEPDTDIVKGLSKALVEAAPARTTQLFLEVSIRDVRKQRWRLDRDPVAVDWLNNDGTWHAVSEGSELGISRYDAVVPLSRTDYGAAFGQENKFCVLAPEVDGDPVFLAAICDGPASFRPGEIDPGLPSEISRSLSGHNGATGFEEAVRSHVLWSVARPVHPIASMASRMVARQTELLVVQQLCGRNWVAVEQKTNISAGSLYEVLAKQAIASGLAAGGELPTVPLQFERQFGYSLSRNMSSAWPRLSAETIDLDFEKFAEMMDGAVACTYEALAPRVEDELAEAFADADPYSTPEEWQSALEAALEQTSGRSLAKSILPAGRGEQLKKWDYSLSETQLVSFLAETHVDLSPRGRTDWIDPSSIQDCMHLWIDPSKLIKQNDWLASLAKLLQDRQTARAIRYAALRYRAAHNKASGHD